MVVPFAPGGVYDTLGRVYAAALSQTCWVSRSSSRTFPAPATWPAECGWRAADPDGYQFLFGGQVPQLAKCN